MVHPIDIQDKAENKKFIMDEKEKFKKFVMQDDPELGKRLGFDKDSKSYGLKKSRQDVFHHKDRGPQFSVTPTKALGSLPKLIGTSPKIIFIVVVYVILLSSSAYAFQATWVTFSDEDVVSIFEGDIDGGADVGIPFGNRLDEVKDFRELTIVVREEGYNLDQDKIKAFNLLHGGEPLVSADYSGTFLLWPDGHVMTSDAYWEMMYGESDDGWWERVTAFFGSIVDGFSMVVGILTLNFYPAVELPVLLQWLPFLMILPVWIYITLLVLPIAIETLKAIAGIIDAVIPFT